MDEKEIRKILKEETVIPDNIDKAMEDVLKGILDSPDERMISTKNLIVKSDKGRSKNSGNKKKIIRILLPVAAVLGVSTGVLATKLGWLHKELEQQGGYRTGSCSNGCHRTRFKCRKCGRCDFLSYNAKGEGLEPVYAVCYRSVF